jgi:hypothetical protein
VNSTTLQTGVFQASELNCAAFAPHLPQNQKAGDCFILVGPRTPGYPFDVGKSVAYVLFRSSRGCFLLSHAIWLLPLDNTRVDEKENLTV